MNTSIQQISQKEALVQVDNSIFIKDPSIKRYLQNRCKYDEQLHGYLVDIEEVQFLKDKVYHYFFDSLTLLCQYLQINYHIPAKQKKNKLSEIPDFVNNAYKPISNKLKIYNLKGQLTSEITYGNENIANELDLSQQHISDAVRMAFQMKGRVILADDPGLNSSITAVNIAYAYDYKIPFLILSSSTQKKYQLKINVDQNKIKQRQKWKWILKQEFNLKDNEIQIVYNDQTQFDFKRDVIILTYEQASKREQELRQIKVVLVDEAHYLRNMKYVSERRLMEYLCERKRIILLSNYCLIQTPQDLFPLLRIIRPDCFYNEKSFKSRYVDNLNNYLELHYLMNNCAMIRRQKSMFDIIQDDDKLQQPFSIKFIGIESDKTISSAINNLLFNAHRAQASNYGKGIISQCYVLSLDAKIKGCLQFIDDQLEKKPNEKIVIFGYHQRAFELVSNHLQEKGISFLNIDKKMSYQDKEQILNQRNNNTKIYMMSYTNHQDLQLSTFSTAIILELSWHPHILEQAIHSLNGLNQINDKVEVYILEGIGTLDKVLKGKYLKWVELKNRILDGKKDQIELNGIIQDIIPIQNNQINKQGVSFDLEYTRGIQSTKKSNSSILKDKQQKRSRKRVVNKDSNNNNNNNVDDNKIIQLSNNNKMKSDLIKKDKNGMQLKARTVQQIKDLKKQYYNSNNGLISNKNYNNKQQNDTEIYQEEEIEEDDDDIENFSNDKSYYIQNYNQIQANNNNNKIKNQNNLHKNTIFIQDEQDSNCQDIHTISSRHNNQLNQSSCQSKNIYSEQEEQNQNDDDNEEEDYEDDVIEEDEEQQQENNKMSNILYDLGSDLDMDEFDNEEIDSEEMGIEETPIHKIQSQRSDSHISVYKQILQKINHNASSKYNINVKPSYKQQNKKNVNMINDYDNDNKDEDDEEDCNEIENIIQLSKQNRNQTTAEFKQNQNDKVDNDNIENDLDYIMKELEIEYEINDKESENINELKQQSKNILVLDDHNDNIMQSENNNKYLQKLSLNKPQNIQLLKKQPLEIIVENESHDDDEQDECDSQSNVQIELNSNKNDSSIEQINVKNNGLGFDEFSNNYLTILGNKDSVFTKCSTNHYPNELQINTTPISKQDCISVFDQIILDIEQNKFDDEDEEVQFIYNNNKKKNQVGNKKQQKQQNLDKKQFNETKKRFVFDEQISLNGQNAIGFDLKNIKLNEINSGEEEQQQQCIDLQQNNLKFNIQSKPLLNKRQNIESNQVIHKEKRFTKSNLKLSNQSFTYDPKSSLIKKKIKID